MDTVLTALKAQLPDITFRPGNEFLWSPSQHLICYRVNNTTESDGIWALLHEASHGILGHTTYASDFELLTLEVAAWHHAQELGKSLGIAIDEEHIQDCLDTYRDWLHRRSTCPTCSTVAIQQSPTEYSCHNCLTRWSVTESRFCRPYRTKITSLKTESAQTPSQTTFR